MTDERWARVKALFQAALERPVTERCAFLAAAAADDDALRREVESLLVADAAEFSFLDRVPIVAAEVAALLEDHGALIGQSLLEDNIVGEALRRADEAGAMFGPYRLLQPLGEGGMGAVWLAQQEHPIRRTVAVKVVKPGFDSREVLSRFESERQALAILNHQHIAKVFDAGVTGDGRPYFVMEHVEGSPITALADRHALTLQQRLELFLQVCDAVQHAHQKGVLHRDLKPGNILVCDQDGHLVAKVIDFGIAKAVGQHLTGDTLTTEFGVLVGTPEYMSPEQAGLVDEAVDTRTDIYSLGLVLYELLVGTPPFEARELRRKTVLEALRVIREDEPPRLATRLRAQGREAADEVARLRRTETRTLLRQLHGDLEWMTARAIEKEPTRRYASVSELRADIGRYLQGEPVLAGPPSTLYRLRKLARRHRAVAAALAIVAVAVTLSAIVSTLALVRAVRAEDRTRRQLVGSLVAQGMQKVDEADPLTGVLYLIRALELETDADRIRSHRIRIGETLQRAPRLVRVWRAGPHMLALSSRGLVATDSTDGAVEIRNMATGEPHGPDLQQGAAITDAEFSSDGAALAVASENGHVRLWDPTDGRLIREFVSQAAVADVALSPDGQLVAAIGTDGVVNVWDVRRGALRFAGRHEGEGRRAVFSHSGAVLATAGQDGVRVWQVTTGTPSDRMLRHDGVQGVTHIAFSRGDAWLASAGWDSTARLWDVRTMRQIGGVMRHDARVTGVTFAGESTLLVTTSIDRTTRTWRIPETSAIGAPLRSASVVQQPADVSRSLVIASPTQGGAVDLWSVDGERAAPSLPHAGQAMVRFDPTGRFLVTTADEGLARIWDLAPAMGSAHAPRIVQDEWDFAWDVVASPDGCSVAVSSGGSPDRGAVRVFDVGTGAPLTPAMRFRATNMPVAFSLGGRRLLTASGAGDVRLWDTRTSEPLTPQLREQFPIYFAAFSPAGETFVVAGGMNVGTSGAARVRSASDGAARTGLLPHDAPVYKGWFSPDGRRLLTAITGSRNIKAWDPATGHLAWAVHHGGVATALWSADGATVFTGASDQWIRAWNGSSGAPQPPAIKMVGGISSVGVTRDGARLLAGTSAGDVRLADLAHGGQVISAMRHKGYVYQSRFSHDGSLAFTSASDQTARLWDGRTGEPLSPSLPAERISRNATFLAGGSALAWAGDGVFVDELTIEDRSIEQLRVLAESAAGRAISESGTEVALPTEEVEVRFMAVNRSSRATAASAVVDYQRARARLSWRRGAFEEVVGRLAPLGAQGALHWPDFMRLVGAYAATSQWQDALGELRKYHARWQAAPELLYMEAVALARLRDEAGAVRHCRAALESTRNTQHPERAYWAARACLVPATVVSNDIAEIETRILLAYPRMSGNLGQAELRGAMLLRGGRSQEAFDLLKSAVPTDATVRAAILLVAAAAARAGLRVEALNWLKLADAIPKPAVYRHMRPWLDAEADALQEEVLSTLNRSSKIRTKSK